jgi:hypothetical protein
MKRIAALVIAGMMGVFLMACSEQPKQPDVKIENHPVTTPAPTEAPVEKTTPAEPAQ